MLTLVSMSTLAQEEQSHIIDSSPGLALAQTLVGLVVVILAIYALAWTLKRLNMAGLGQKNAIQVVSALALGTREKAILIDVEGKQLLLGVAPGRVSTLHVFDQAVVHVEPKFDKEAEQKNAQMSSLAANSVSEFSKKLNTFLGQSNK